MSIIIIFIFKKSGSGGPVELLIDLVSPNVHLYQNSLLRIPLSKFCSNKYLSTTFFQNESF